MIIMCCFKLGKKKNQVCLPEDAALETHFTMNWFPFDFPGPSRNGLIVHKLSPDSPLLPIPWTQSDHESHAGGNLRLSNYSDPFLKHAMFASTLKAFASAVLSWGQFQLI